MLHADSRLHGPSDGALPPSAEAVPPVVPGYRVERELGRGGASRVWLVHPQDGGPARALKVPDHEVAASLDALDHEMRAIGELRHDHLVRPQGVVQTDQGPGLLSEYQPGGSLGALVRAVGPLPVGQVVTTLVPIAQALDALHGHGVVHADVSPGNVLYSVDGRPSLGDLGCARLLGGAARPGGTPGFQAPETRLDTRTGPAADVYSLAAVGWYALTGRAPVITHARAPLSLTLPEISSEVVSLLEAGLSMDPQDRPTAAQFATACYDWAAPEPVDLFGAAHPSVAMELPTRRPASTASGSSRWRGQARSRRRALVAVTAVAAMSIGAMIWTMQQDSGPGAGSGQVRSAETRTTPSATRPPAEATHHNAPSAVTAPAVSDDPAEEAADLLADDEVAQAVRALGPARTRALVDQDEDQVRMYTADGSEAQEQDLALVAELTDRDLRYEGLELTVQAVGPATEIGSEDLGPVRVPVELEIAPYTTHALGEEAALAEQATTVTERVDLEMVRTSQGWRLNRILAAGA